MALVETSFALTEAQHSEIAVAVEAFYANRPISRNRSIHTGRATDREIAFATAVVRAASELTTCSRGLLTILFDLDETLIRTRFTSNETQTTHTRPSIGCVLKLIEAMTDDNYEVGILSSRGHSHLESELEAPSYTTVLGNRLNRQFVISSRPGSPILKTEALRDAPTMLDDRTEPQALAAIQHVVDPLLAIAIKDEDYKTIGTMVSGMRWYDTKLAIVDHLAQTHPERSFVCVDDLPFPAAIDPRHHQVRGVSLGEAASFFG